MTASADASSGPSRRRPSSVNSATSPDDMKRCVPGRLDGAGQARGDQQGAQREGGLVGRRDQHDVGAHDIGDDPGQVRVVRAAEQQRVDRGLADRRQQPLGQHRHLVARRDASFDELDEARDMRRTSGRRRSRPTPPRRSTARWYEPDPTVPTVPMTPIRPLRVASTSACAPGWMTPTTGTSSSAARSTAEAAVLHATTMTLASCWSIRKRAICRGVRGDLGLRLRAVRVAARVADVDDVLGRQQVDDGAGDGQATEATVEHADRPVRRGVHRADTLPAGSIGRQARPMRRPVIAKR